MIGITITPSHIDYSKILTDKTVDNIIMGECIILTGFAKELSPVDYGQLKNSIMWATNKASGGLNQGGPSGMSTGAKKLTAKGKVRKRKARPGTTSAFNYLEPPAEEKTGYVGSNLEYAGAVEYGRRDMPNYPRQPYLRPAIDYSKRARELRRGTAIRAAIRAAYHG
ncbi:MAG: hypothetical protein WC481_07615 [Candidatus Omnitrophota bacterium]